MRTKTGRKVAPRRRRKQIGTPVNKKYINRNEAAVYLGCSAKHVVCLVRSGLVPEYDFGPFTKRYTTSDLDAYAQAHRKGA